MEDTVFSGAWWRFDRYEVRDGYIRPATDAALQRYFPLEDFQVHRSGRAEHVAPYLSLARLAPRCTFDRHGRLMPDGEAAVLSWCNENGLLGLLHHQLCEVRLAPRWEAYRANPPERTEELRGILARSGLASAPSPRSGHPPRGRRAQANKEALTQRVYRRTNLGTFEALDQQPLSSLRPGNGRRSKHAAPRKQWGLMVPTVLVQQLYSLDWAQEPMHHTWARFFPTIPEGEIESYQYPHPMSEPFWRLYAEPVRDFLTAAYRLQEAILAAAPPETETRAPSTGPLNALVAPTGPVVVRTDDGLEQRLLLLSLLGGLATTAQLDLVGDRRIARCQNEKCGEMIVAHGYQTIYCSVQCRYAAVKRAQRKRTRGRQKR